MAKIYPQFIKGKYRSIKNYTIIALFALYYLGSWIRLDRGNLAPSQAMLIDLPKRRAYFFNIEIWPQETYYITFIMILAALGLIYFTSLFGRLWCGYTCPHTVFTDIFIKIEHFFQGDRNARIKLDSDNMSREKFFKKFLTHVSWLAVAFSFAFAFVCYFYDAPSLFYSLIYLDLNGSAVYWLLGLTLTTYLFAGFVREKVCTHMCPYGRFQSAMIERDTTIVTYDQARGEQRGGLNTKVSGDCIDCNKCVVVCPAGIDIRDGLQMECIGCGLCVDACNSVMEKIGRPLNLIGYKSQSNIPLKEQIFKLKNIIFSTLLLLVLSGLIYSLNHKSTFEVTISRDRGALFTWTPNGDLRNTYNINIINKSLVDKTFTLKIKGLNNAKINIHNTLKYQDDKIFVKAGDEVQLRVFISIAELHSNFKEKVISFILLDVSTHEKIVNKNMFIAAK